MKALLLENIHPDAERLLTERGIEVSSVKGALDEDELRTALPGVQLLGIRSKTNVTRAVLDQCPELLAIGAFCIGTNQIDIPAASRQRHRGLQRSVLQHPQRGRVGDRGDHFARPAPHGQEHCDARRCLGQVGQGRPRGPGPNPGHRRLRQHRQSVVGSGGGPRHAGVVLRRRGQAGPGQRPPLRQPGGVAQGGRDRLAARGRPTRQRRSLRCRSSSRRCDRAASSSTCAEASWSTTMRSANTYSPGTLPALRSTSSPRSRRRLATTSPPACRTCRTSS